MVFGEQNEKGIIFEEVADFPEDLPRIEDDSIERNLTLGEQVMNKEKLSSILKISSTLCFPTLAKK